MDAEKHHAEFLEFLYKTIGEKTTVGLKDHPETSFPVMITKAVDESKFSKDGRTVVLAATFTMQLHGGIPAMFANPLPSPTNTKTLTTSDDDAR